MENLWLKETMELLSDLQNQRTALDDKIEALHEELFELDDRIAAGHSLVRAYIEKHNLAPLPLDIEPSYLASMSYPEMLVEIAKAREGYLKVTDAVEILIRANVGRDKRSIQANVYSALRREKQKFVRIAPGEYQYVNHVKKKSTERSGVRQAVKELKKMNPKMTKRDVLNRLTQIGFDFKGRQAERAINMAWVSLGYPKEENQTKL